MVRIFGRQFYFLIRICEHMRACGEDIWRTVLIFGEDMRAYARACALVVTIFGGQL